MNNKSELFELFWENSKFNHANIGEFQKSIEAYSGMEHEIPALQYSSPDIVLPRNKGKLDKLMQRRMSRRNFADKQLTLKNIGAILGSLSGNNSGGRVIASAGATYPLEIFCLLNNVQGENNGKVAYYNVDNHSFSIVGNAPNWDDSKRLFNIETQGTPAVVVIFVLFSERTTMKYSERGGRFALIEVGEALQSLSLAVASEGLTGCAMGGMLDDEIKEILGLSKTTAKIALGYMCGFGA